jgi:L-alanine-DL-glutamate epimerase-like enolase superfamily enzyme
MSIVSLEARHVRIRLRRPVKHASHSRTETDNLVVVCKLADGSVGTGEGVPREYVTGETIDSAMSLLKESDLAGQFAPCATFAGAVRQAEAFRLKAIPGDDRDCAGNSARCAVELALLDAYGRMFGEPLMNVAKMLAPDLYEPKERVQYSGIILTAKGWKARLMALAYRWRGFRQIKVKVGIPGLDDAQRLKVLRRMLGPNREIRVDANEAWAPGEVLECIRALESFGITSVEQPVPHEQVGSLTAVRQQTKVPIMLDESLCSMVDAGRAVEAQTCDLFNLRLSKCGGFIPTLRLAQFAKANGLGYQLGCQVGETAILSAAGRHFATSVKEIRNLEGSFDRHLVWDSLAQDDITFGKGGWAPALVGCGLGVKIDPVRLDAVTVRREVLLGG